MASRLAYATPGDERSVTQVQQHAVVAQGVGLDALQAQELGHAFVVGLQKLLVDVMVDRRLIDFGEPKLGEESDHEGQAEHPPHTYLPRAFDQLREDLRSDPLTQV